METISQVMEQYIEAKKAQRISPNTLKDYNNAFQKFKKTYGEDTVFRTITSREIAHFLGQYTELSKKTVLNHHTALSSLWHWAITQEIVRSNVVRQVTPPRPEKREIIPLSKSEVGALFKAASRTDFPFRDRAILFIFLDTGLRLSEISNVKLKDINWIDIPSFVVMGKGGKERRLPLSKTTVQGILDYLGTRNIILPVHNHNGHLFLNNKGQSFTLHGIRKLLYRLSEDAQIRRVNPHRLRHTFAIWYLRLGGNIYVLQKILGHSTLDMVKRYLAIVQTDIENDHKQASPVSNWKFS